LEGSHIKKQWLPWILVTILTSLNAHANCVEGDCENGKGTWKVTGYTYEGDFINGLRSGKGKSKQVSHGVDASYEGGFLNGLRSGKGKSVDFSDGYERVEEGYFQDGKFVETIADREKREKYDKIFNACLIEKGSDVDMQVRSLEVAVKTTCESIAENPSWFETLKYD